MGIRCWICLRCYDVDWSAKYRNTRRGALDLGDPVHNGCCNRCDCCAIVVRDQTRPFWIGCSVVAVGFVVASASTNLTMYHTTVGPIATALTATQEITRKPGDTVRIVRRESVRRIIDLRMIPVLSIFGGYFAAYLSRNRTPPNNGR